MVFFATKVLDRFYTQSNLRGNQLPSSRSQESLRETMIPTSLESEFPENPIEPKD